MVKKITIGMSDELHEGMQKWKGSMNFSKIFRDAVSTNIQRKEAFKKQLKGEKKEMNEIIERLRNEKQSSNERWFDIGKTDGLEFAKSVSYDDLQYAVRWITIQAINDNVITTSLLGDEVLGDYFSSFFDEYEELDWVETTPGNHIPNDAYCQWEAGWHEAVVEFWEEIKDQL